METIILIITNLLLLGVVFYMIRKLREKSEAKELEENLRTQNEEFLEYLSENKITYGEYEDVKQEKTDAINKWFAKLMHEDSIFYGWQWQDAKGSSHKLTASIYIEILLKWHWSWHWSNIEVILK